MSKDLLVILGGGISMDGSLPDIPRYRVERGIALYEEGVAPRMLFSGRWAHTLHDDPPWTEAEAMRAYAESLGIPHDSILLEEDSLDTLGNAYFSKVNICEPNGWKDLCVVTSEFHLPRTSYIFRKVLGPDYSLEFVPAPSHLSASELEERLRGERVTQSRVESWLEPIQDGDTAAVREILFKKHRGYVSAS